MARGVEHLDAAVLLATVATSVNRFMVVEGTLLGAQPGQVRVQRGLVVLDADQQGVAGRGGLRKAFPLTMQRVGGGETRSVCAVNSTPVRPSSAISLGTAAISSGAPASSWCARTRAASLANALSTWTALRSVR